MKPFSLFMIAAALFMLAPPAPAQTVAQVQGEEREQRHHEATRTVAAQPDVVVSLCLASGGIVVRGWDRQEIRARAGDVERLEVRGGGAASAQPTKRVEVLVSKDEDEDGFGPMGCAGDGHVELDVPRGATVSLQIHEGDIEVSGVAEARVESLNGDVEVARVSRSVEVSTMTGDISVKDASGRVRLRAINGSVEATNVRAVEPSDDFLATSTSGDVRLERISHIKVRGMTIGGDVEMTGPLTQGGSYELKSTSGDVSLILPSDASFRLIARVIANGEIITDFPVKATANTAATATSDKNKHSPLTMSRLVGTVGSGDAELNLYTFSGTVHLKKQ